MIKLSVLCVITMSNNPIFPYKWYTSNAPLTLAQMENNAEIIYRYFTTDYGVGVDWAWSKLAIAAMLGNMEAESTINPGRWENGDINNLNVGYGLVQWTPASKYIDWAGAAHGNGNKQCERIEWERMTNTQFGKLSYLPRWCNELCGIPKYVVDADGKVWYIDIPGIDSFSDFAWNQNWPEVWAPGRYYDLSDSLEYATICFLLQYERPLNPRATVSFRLLVAKEWYDFIGGSHGVEIDYKTAAYLMNKRRKHKGKRVRKIWTL